MIAIEIRVNGVLKATCGADDLRSVGASITASGRLGANSPTDDEPRYVVECVGWHRASDDVPEVLKWVGATISPDDEISFRFVETEKADSPIDRQVLSEDTEP